MNADHCRRPVLVPALVSLGLAWLAVGRQRALEPLSAADLSFFHQSTWSASRGLGFAQTVLGFEGQGLLDCLHLSLIRAAWVPFYALAPHLETLVALQGLAVGLGAFAVAALARHHGASVRTAALLALAYGVHPVTVGLACADLRPLVFAVPALLAAVLGVERRSVGLVLFGALGVIAAREEAPWMLLALLPFALHRRHWRAAGALAAASALALAWPLWAWGELSKISATTDHLAHWSAILEGQRPLVRSLPEAAFALVSVAVIWPALRAPLLLLPAVAAWLYLCVMSGLALTLPSEQGVHYLAVAHPFLWAAAAVGVGSMPAGGRLQRGAIGVALAGALAALVTLPRAPAWAVATLAPSPDVRAHLAVGAPLIAGTGGVVVEPRLAPLLAGRARVHVRGNHYEDRAEIPALVEHLQWAVLYTGRSVERDPAALERKAWRRALAARGFSVDPVGYGMERWEAEGAR